MDYAFARHAVRDGNWVGFGVMVEREMLEIRQLLDYASRFGDGAPILLTVARGFVETARKRVAEATIPPRDGVDEDDIEPRAAAGDALPDAYDAEMADRAILARIEALENDRHENHHHSVALSFDEIIINGQRIRLDEPLVGEEPLTLGQRLTKIERQITVAAEGED